MEDNKNYERGEHLENITDASMKDDDYFNASRNIDRKYITIEGARENNLKNINVKIPRDKFVVVTGLSGSGKSSLAFDTIYAEGQRRYTTISDFSMPEWEYHTARTVVRS